MGKQKYKEGDLFRVKSNTQGHNYVLGQIYRVVQRQPQGGGYYMGTDPNTGFTGNWIFHTDMEPASLTVTELEKQKNELLAQVAALDEKLAYLRESGLDAYDPDEYKIHKALSVLDNTTDPRERTKALAKLIREVV